MNPADILFLLAITLFVVGLAVASELWSIVALVRRIGDLPARRFLRRIF